MYEKRKKLLLSVFGLIIVALTSIGGYYWYNNAYYVSTEDAKIDADLIRVSPQIAGKLLEFDIKAGDRVIKEQILGRQEMLNQPASNIDMSLVRAPIDGVVIKKQGNVGDIVSPGQTLAVLVDPAKIYITANIKEKKINEIVKGQKVDIEIDQYPGVEFTGYVKTIGLAANSAFSLLPSSTGGTFTKVIQRIPVKIEFNSKSYKMLPGTNAVVKIHIR